ncbi:carbamoyltransferase [bacterium]|nr:carbamoyltransferase [bacterium]
MTYILGISSFFHDSAAILLKNGEIVSAVQEERFTRIKHDSKFPINAIKFILKSNNLNLNQINFITFHDKPFIKFDRIIKTYISNVPKGYNSFKMAIPIWIKEKLFLKRLITKNLKKIDNKFIGKNIKFSEHHASHAASAFFPSAFEKAIIITLDGVGEWATTTIALGDKNNIEIKKEINFPHSLGLFYSAFTYYIGFKVNSGEYKLMGLAPYGEPKYVDKILSNLIDVKKDGSFRLNLKYFDFATGFKMINENFCKLFNYKERINENEPLTQFHMDIAASVQNVIEEVILKISRYAFNQYKISNLCLAGGVALNCVANGKILKDNLFKKIWIQPAAGDAGGALGSSLLFWYKELNNFREIKKNDLMKGSYLGPFYSNDEVTYILSKLGASYQKLTDENLINKVSNKLIDGNIIGWFQGKMEFGPRALGARSIIANPKIKDMQKKLNLKIKFRESFRPFAPSILFEDLNEWFDLNQESPYMLLVANILENKKINTNFENNNLFGIDKLNIKRSVVPSVTHVDYSSRIQTVHKETNNRYYDLIKLFKKKTGCPILINTSFNIRGEPIVCSPEDAFNCFMGTDMDYLVIENLFLAKKQQDKKLIKDYRYKFNLD